MLSYLHLIIIIFHKIIIEFFLQNTLINSWNFIDLDPKTIWHGNEHVKNVTVDNIKTIDNDDKVKIRDKNYLFSWETKCSLLLQL